MSATAGPPAFATAPLAPRPPALRFLVGAIIVAVVASVGIRLGYASVGATTGSGDTKSVALIDVAGWRVAMTVAQVVWQTLVFGAAIWVVTQARGVWCVGVGTIAGLAYQTSSLALAILACVVAWFVLWDATDAGADRSGVPRFVMPTILAALAVGALATLGAGLSRYPLEFDVDAGAAPGSRATSVRIANSGGAPIRALDVRPRYGFPARYIDVRVVPNAGRIRRFAPTVVGAGEALNLVIRPARACPEGSGGAVEFVVRYERRGVRTMRFPREDAITIRC